MMSFFSRIRHDRRLLAIILCGISAALALAAFARWGMETHRTMKPLQRVDIGNVDRFWFSRTGNLVVVSDRVTVVPPTGKWTWEGIPNANAAVSDEAEHIAWLTERSVLVDGEASASVGEKLAIEFNGKEELLALSYEGRGSLRGIIEPVFRTARPIVCDNVIDPAFWSQFLRKPQGTLTRAGHFVAYVALDYRYIKVFNATSWDDEQVFRWNDTHGKATAVALSPKGSIAVGTDDDVVFFFDKTRSASQVTAPGGIRDLAFIDSDNVAVTGDFDDIRVLTRPGGIPAMPIVSAGQGTRSQKIAVSPEYIAYMTATGVATARLTPERGITKPGIASATTAGVFLLGLIAAIVFPRPRETTEDEEEPDKRAAPKSVAGPVAPSFDIPDPPQSLIEACREEECILYVGPEIAAEREVPTGTDLARHLLGEAERRGVMTQTTVQALRAQVATTTDVETIIDATVAALGQTGIPSFDLLPRKKRQRGRSLPVHTLIRNLPLAGVITPNLDEVLDRTLKLQILDASDAEMLFQQHAHRNGFLLKLHGSLARPENVIIGRTELEAEIARNIPFAEALSNLFRSRTFLFAGTSLEAIERFVTMIRGAGPTRPHFAVVRVSDDLWRARAEVLRRRFGITTLPYSESSGLVTFLERLVKAVAPERSSAPAPSVRPSRLKSIKVHNIGPFVQQEIEFDRDWTVLLGDNGVGKSNLLRAIAIVLCGKEAAPFAGRVIRSGQMQAVITLQTERDTYVVELRKRSDGSAEMITGARPSDAEGFLALGFPALRTVTWTRRPSRTEGRPRPQVDDVLPLVSSEPDPRVDELKSWILEQRTRSLQAQKRGDDENPYEELLTEFFSVMNEVMPGQDIQLLDIDVATKEVRISTADGDIPIEAVSQGTIALMGWIGVMLQRLYEIHGGSGEKRKPREQYALVVIDEIDAHMHPGWQKQLAPLLTRIFPCAQFVVSTHSPLIVSELRAEQVYVLGRKRKTKEVFVERTKLDLAALRTDQILTSLFGLDYTRGSELEEEIQEFSRLLYERKPEDAERLTMLRQRIKRRVVTSEQPEARAVERVVRETLVELRETASPDPIVRLDNLPEEAVIEMRHKLKALFQQTEDRK